MIRFPNAKINIGLRVTERLPNGYHILKSLMLPTGFCDILEFAPSKFDHLEITGIQIDGSPEENILIKTLSIARKHFEIPPLHIHLHKVIPPGSGLGGGSADAAFFLNMMNDRFTLEMNRKEKEDLIASVGSDCPFFIANRPAIISGTGTILKDYNIDLKGTYLVIARPGFSVSTAEAYAGIKLAPEKLLLENLLSANPVKWKDSVENDFEKSLFPVYPELKRMKEAFYASGAFYASLSGSGSALYGLYHKKPDISGYLKEKVIYGDIIS